MDAKTAALIVAAHGRKQEVIDATTSAPWKRPRERSTMTLQQDEPDERPSLGNGWG